MKDVKKVSLVLTSPTGRTRNIIGVSVNPSQVNQNFTLSDPDMNGEHVTIMNGSTATTYEVVVRQNSGNFTFLNNFVQDCMDEGGTGTGLFKNTSVKRKPETHVLGGVTIQKKESGQHDNSNVDATFTVQAESVRRDNL